MYQKNIFQDGSKTVEGVVSILSPYSQEIKSQEKVEAQKSTANSILPNIDYGLPRQISTDKGLAILHESEEAKALYYNRAQQANMVDYSKKKSMSAIGIDINFGASLNETIQLMLALLERGLMEENSESSKILNTIYDHVANYTKNGVISEALVEGAARLKISMLEDLNTAKGVFYGQNPNAYQTMLMDQIEDYISRIKPILPIFTMDGKEAAEYMDSEINKAYNSVFNYVKTDSPHTTKRTSSLAKERLMNNPWYMGYISEMQKTSPDLVEQLYLASQSPYITDLEEKVIREILAHNDEIKRQKNILKEELGWDQMMAIYDAPQASGGSLNQLLDMEWDLNKTATDDAIHKAITQAPKIGLNFDDYYNSTTNYNPELTASLKAAQAQSGDVDLSTGYFGDIYIRPFIKDPSWTEQEALTKRAEYDRNISTSGSNMKWDELSQSMVGIDMEKEKYMAKLLDPLSELTKAESLDRDRLIQQKRAIEQEKNYYANLKQNAKPA